MKTSSALVLAATAALLMLAAIAGLGAIGANTASAGLEFWDASAAELMPASASQLSTVGWYQEPSETATTVCQDHDCLGIAGAVLRPRASDVEWRTFGSSGCSYASSGNRFTVWSAPLPLPQGALVRGVEMHAQDSSSRDSQASFTVYDRSGKLVDRWDLASSGSSGPGSWTSEEFCHAVDHTQYYYVINWQPREVDAAMQICGFVIAYDLVPGGGDCSTDDSSGLPDEFQVGNPVNIPPGGNACVSFGIPPQSELPALLPLGSDVQSGLPGTRRFCLYGFPVGEQIEVDVQTPDGEYTAHGVFRMDSTSAGSGDLGTPGPPTIVPPYRPTVAPSGGVIQATPTVAATFTAPQLRPPRLLDQFRVLPEPPIGDVEVEALQAIQLEPPPVDDGDTGSLQATMVNGVSVLTLPLWWPVSLPSGVWILEARAPGAEAGFQVYFEPRSGISTRPDEEVDPFLNRHCASYDSDEIVVIEGAGLNPERRLTLGLYRAETYGNTLADRLSARTDATGAFSVDHAIPPSYEAGLYYVIQAPISESLGLQSGSLACFQVSEPD